MGQYVVCAREELPPGARRIIEVAGRSIGVFNVEGALYALRNRCPHRGAPLCQGVLKGLVSSPEPYAFALERDGEILRCPWHGWEFDVTTGRSVFNPHALRVKQYDVTVGSDSETHPTAIETFPVAIERELIIVHVPE